jgi:hypothetical protein
MGTSFRVDSATPAPDDVLLDVIEQYFVSAGIRSVARRGDYFNGGTTGLGANAPEGGLHPVNAGTVVTNQNFERCGCYAMTSASGAVNGRQGNNFEIPFGADRSNDPAAANRPLRYILECLLIRAAPIVADTGFGYGFRRFNGLLGDTASGPGLALESLTTVNGGNWTVFRRLTDAGALLTTDTGIPGSTRIFARFIYDDTTNPRFQVEVNGATVLDLVGLANQLDPSGTEVYFPGFFQGSGTFTGVGQVDRVRQCRFRISALAGFPL